MACFYSKFCFLAIVLLLAVPSVANAVSQPDISILKVHADAFNASRNYITPFGPAEQYCLSTGTFLTYQPCYDMPTCMQTANLVCTVSGQQGCDVTLLATHILAYKNGVDRLNAAYSSFLSSYNGFSTSNVAGSFDLMDSAFDSMKSAADEVSQSKLRLPDQIPCPCTNSSDCCLGRCPEARFNYSAITSGKAAIVNLSIKSCTDGTPGEQCSSTKPKECVIGVLIDNAQRCGCPPNKRAVGSVCEFIPCNDNGVTVPVGTCSPAKEKKCVDGVLVSKASECGCPSGKRIEGDACIGYCADGTREGNCSSTLPLECANGGLINNSAKCGCPSGYVPFGTGCVCPVQINQICNKTTVAKYHDVMYVFDRGFNKTVNEKYTFEKESCYSVQSKYSGTNCSQLAGVNATLVSESPEPMGETTKHVSCDRCPMVCTRAPPNALACGSCTCPSNLGFCDIENVRANITSTPAYCANELWLPQKEDLKACKNNSECKTSICRENECYNSDFFTSIFNWFRKLFGAGK